MRVRRSRNGAAFFEASRRWATKASAKFLGSVRCPRTHDHTGASIWSARKRREVHAAASSYFEPHR
jgi:hypothetical protein